MAKVTIYHDTRAGKNDFPLKIKIAHRNEVAYISTNIRVSVDQWDKASNMVVNHEKARTFNNVIKAKMTLTNATILKFDLSGELKKMTASDLKAIIENGGEIPKEMTGHNFYEFYLSRMEKKVKPSTKSSYRQSLNNLLRFDPELRERTFDEMNVKYMEDFDSWMHEQGICINSRNVYYRNIRSVFNDAIDDELTHTYPFRKFKLKKVATRKRSLTVEELRTLRDYPCEEWQEKFRDTFMLMFYLCGINAADLYPAKKRQVRRGRLEYERAKTYKLYSIKIEPEAQAIIDKYKGEEYLLKFCEGGKDYKYYLQRMTRELKKIGPYKRSGYGGKKVCDPLFPELTQYWVRHTWATIAAELDIPKETIAAALGHDMGNTTTAIYINFNQKKVDDANRKVIDYVNGKK